MSNENNNNRSVDTVGYAGNTLGDFYGFSTSNIFYTYAPAYYLQFYTGYLQECLAIYDGWMARWHNRRYGLTPQKLLQSVATGLNNMLFAKGIDFNGMDSDYAFATKWARKSNFYTELKKAHKLAIAGGTSLLKINRRKGQLYCSAHRIDTFFVDVDSAGEITKCRVFYDAIHSTVTEEDVGEQKHFGICEERYYNRERKPCVTASVYVSTSIVTETASRPTPNSRKLSWGEIPFEVKMTLKETHPEIEFCTEEYLPFNDSLGCALIKFTDGIPVLPNMPFGQPIGDILTTESFQYDQLKLFERIEVDLAKAKAFVPEDIYNRDDPLNPFSEVNDRYFLKYPSTSGDDEQILTVQPHYRSTDISNGYDTVLKMVSFKLQISGSSIASFLSEGAGAKTATEIVNERTKTDTWISGQINLNTSAIDRLLEVILRFYNHQPVGIVFKAEDQSPFLEKLKTYSDVFSAGNISSTRFVKDVYKNLSAEEQDKEINYLEATRNQQVAMQDATMQSWNDTSNGKEENNI